MATIPKVLLVNAPAQGIFLRDLYCVSSSKADYVWQPIDLVVLSGALSKSFHVTIRDCVGSGLSSGKLIHSLSAHQRFDFVIALVCSITLKSDVAALREVKCAYPEARILIIGDFVREHGIKFLQQFDVADACILDFTTDNLCEVLLEWPAITSPRENFIIRRGEELFVGPLVRGGTRFSISLPHHEKFENSKYRQPVNRYLPVAAVLGSVGCQFRCGFCTQGSIAFRARPPEEIVDELMYLRDIGIREVLFRDQLLEGNHKNFRRVLELMIEQKVGMSWYGNSRADTLTEELIVMMKEAGCHSVLMGVETSNDAVLVDMDTGKSGAKTSETIAILRRHGIHVLGYFILGLPGETRETIKQTIDLACSLDIDLAAFTTPSPDYGTVLRTIAIERGLLDSDKIENSDRSATLFALNENVSIPDLRSLRRRAYLSFYLRPKVIFRIAGIVGVRPRFVYNNLRNLVQLVAKQVRPPEYA